MLADGTARRRSWWPLVVIASVALARWAYAWQPGWLSERWEAYQHASEHQDQELVELPYTDEARALLRGLAVGDDVAGWTVVRVEGVLDNDEIRVTLARGEPMFTATLAPAGRQAFSAPVSAAGWELFYSRVQPPHSLDDGEYVAVLEALAARIDSPQ